MAEDDKRPSRWRLMRERREARRKAVVRIITYDGQNDTSSRELARRLQEGRPELGITTRIVSFFRRRHARQIHGTPRR